MATKQKSTQKSKYQSDEVDRSGGVVKTCNRRLRSACMLIAKNLTQNHPVNRGLAALWKESNLAALDRQCRVADRANRMVFQLVGGRQVWRGNGVDRQTLLAKLREFHRTHATELSETVVDMHEAFTWLPRSTYAQEAEPLEEISRKKRRGATSIGGLLIPLSIRLGVRQENKAESKSSRA